MKILKHNAGVLTNWEVLEFLRSKGASSDLRGINSRVSISESKVFEYLIKTPASSQSREKIQEFAEECKRFDLAKAEIVSLVNVRTSIPVEAHPMVEEADERSINLTAVVELVKKIFPQQSNDSAPGDIIKCNAAA